MSLTVGSLFAGIGGIDKGLEDAGCQIIWQIEIDDWCRRILRKHWPEVPKHGNIREIDFHKLERPDILAGGFPCQSSSHAGKRRGRDDERWLWPEFARAIRELRPRYVLVENVPGILTPIRDRVSKRVIQRAPIDEVLGDLAASGYDAEWTSLSAEAIGAPHIRDRVWIVAYTHPSGRHQVATVFSAHTQRNCQPPSTQKEAGYILSTEDSGRIWCFPDTGTLRVPDGLPHWVDRLGGLGNAVVPQCAEYIGRLIIEHAARNAGMR